MPADILTNPYPLLVKAGAELSNHESDLYVRATGRAIAIVEASGWNWSRFTDAEGRAWLEVPFAYDPWWERRRR
jgi:hypothetical protein